MEFWDNFDSLFKKQHGSQIYNEICEQIKKENPENYDSNYVTYIFKVAFFIFIGLDNSQICKFFKDKKQSVDIEYTRLIHKKSIAKIKKHLNDAHNKFSVSFNL